MNKQDLALILMNEFMDIFKLAKLSDLTKLEMIDKNSFDENKDKLSDIIEKYKTEILGLYDAGELSFYNRKRSKNYPYVFFKNIYKSNNINLKTIKKLKKISQTNYTYRTYCYVEK
jgi:hypothetical protein